jgi:two-component system NtrC family sensor kinase
MTQQTNLAELGSAAAGVAHDINNQLTLILNYLETRDIAGARAATARCSALTSSLLSWCRGETLHLQPIDLNDFLLDFADNLHLPDAVHLTLETTDTATRINADPLALTRILTNLISNACDAMHNEGAIVIRAAARTIEVADSGPGIPPAAARHIFDPFYTTKGAHGTGLGLAIVREIMSRHGGHVSIRHEPNHGAIFVLRFRV